MNPLFTVYYMDQHPPVIRVHKIQEELLILAPQSASSFERVKLMALQAMLLLDLIFTMVRFCFYYVEYKKQIIL